MPIYPIGIIDQSTPDGITFSIPPQNGREMPKPGDPVTVWNQINPPHGPLARLTGEITEASTHTGALVITRQDVPAQWPAAIQPFGAGNPVYITAGHGSFVPDPSRPWASPEEYSLMAELAKDHERATGIAPGAARLVPRIRPDEPELQ